MKVDVGGSVLDVQVDGPEDAPAILHFNGAACTLRQWDKVLPRLTGKFRSIRLDVRGVGQSTPAEDPSQYTFEQYCSDANKVLDAVGVEMCHVWSMAWGSRLGIAFASMMSRRVISATLNDANTDPADVTAQKEGHKKAMKLQAAAGIERFTMPEGLGDHAYPDQVPLAMAAASAGFDLKTAAHSLTMPVLIVTGDCDPNIAPSREIISMAHNAKLVELENVGHGSILQRPDLTTDIFLNFQASLGNN